MNRPGIAIAALAVVSLAAPAVAGDEKPMSPRGQKQSKAVQRGEYLVNTSGCHDCHSPKLMTPEGPMPDLSKSLSGATGARMLPPPPKLAAGPWAVVGTADLTTWSGPWGVTYARNLTPDKVTGLGAWTERNFLDTVKTGRRLGVGRMLLPPMPVSVLQQFTEDDLKAIFAYLQSIPAISNDVPEPQPPPQAKSTAAAPTQPPALTPMPPAPQPPMKPAPSPAPPMKPEM